MKLARFHVQGPARWALVDTTSSMLQPIAGGIPDWGAQLCSGDREALTPVGEPVPLNSVRLAPPFEPGAKIIVVGANYRKHLKEFDLEMPSQPHVFMKPSGALIGAEDDIRYSPLTSKLDFEVELVVVFGKSFGGNDDPMLSVLGYTVGNDVSARDLQPGTPGIGMDLLSAKGLDGSCPLGPWIVTRDEIGDGSPDLSMTTKVNGELRQDGRTGDMTWSVPELAEFVNVRTRFQAGDIMFTGTPEGVAQRDGRFLKDGDLVETEIERIGALRNRVRRPKQETL